jgi:hypothetical protein
VLNKNHEGSGRPLTSTQGEHTITLISHEADVEEKWLATEQQAKCCDVILEEERGKSQVTEGEKICKVL